MLIGLSSPDYTGYGNFQQPQSAFNTIASLPPPQPQQNQNGGDKFAPSNIFSAMKRQDFGKPEEQQPQDASEFFYLFFERIKANIEQINTIHCDLLLLVRVLLGREMGLLIHEQAITALLG